MMWVLNFFGALVTLMIGALILNFVSQGLEGRKTYFLHFGFVAMIVVIGAVVFHSGVGSQQPGFSLLRPC